MGRAWKGLGPAVALCAVTLMAAPAMAVAASNGAQVIPYDYCNPDGSGGTVCASGQSIYQTTETASGNVVAVINDKYTFSDSGPGCSYATSGQDHSTSVLTSDGDRQAHGVQSIDFSFTCYGGTQHCVSRFNIASAAGVIRHDKEETTCESS